MKPACRGNPGGALRPAPPAAPVTGHPGGHSGRPSSCSETGRHPHARDTRTGVGPRVPAQLYASEPVPRGGPSPVPGRGARKRGGHEAPAAWGRPGVPEGRPAQPRAGGAAQVSSGRGGAAPTAGAGTGWRRRKSVRTQPPRLPSHVARAAPRGDEGGAGPRAGPRLRRSALRGAPAGPADPPPPARVWHETSARPAHADPQPGPALPPGSWGGS